MNPILLSCTSSQSRDLSVSAAISTTSTRLPNDGNLDGQRLGRLLRSAKRYEAYGGRLGLRFRHAERFDILVNVASKR